MNETTLVDRQLREMQEHDLEQVLTWRNHEDVRKYMFSTHEITWQEHVKWFQAVKGQVHRKLLVYEQADVPMGFIQFKAVSPDDAKSLEGGVLDWGFYMAPHTPKGCGRALGQAALEYAFQTCQAHKVVGQALGMNVRSIRFHLALGFQTEGLLREQHFDGQTYHDLHCFGLLKPQWQQQWVTTTTSLTPAP